MVRPLPHHLSQVARAGDEDEPDLNQLPPDDEFFMDDVEDLDDQMVFSDGLPLAADDDTGSLLDLQRPYVVFPVVIGVVGVCRWLSFELLGFVVT